MPWFAELTFTCYSDLHWEEALGGENKATKTAHFVQPGAEDEANAVFVSKVNRNYTLCHLNIMQDGIRTDKIFCSQPDCSD